MPVERIEVRIKWPEEEGGVKVFEVIPAGISFKAQMRRVLDITSDAIIDEERVFAESEDVDDLLKTWDLLIIWDRVCYALQRRVVSPKIVENEALADGVDTLCIHNLTEMEQAALYLTIMRPDKAQHVAAIDTAAAFIQNESYLKALKEGMKVGKIPSEVARQYEPELELGYGCMVFDQLVYEKVKFDDDRAAWDALTKRFGKEPKLRDALKTQNPILYTRLLTQQFEVA